jgi:hypothetical protein
MPLEPVKALDKNFAANRSLDYEAITAPVMVMPAVEQLLGPFLSNHSVAQNVWKQAILLKVYIGDAEPLA